MSSPFVNPGTPPIQPVPSPTEGPKTSPETLGQRPFSLPKKGEGIEATGPALKQSPMEAAKDKPASVRWTQDQMLERMEQTKQKFGESKVRLNGPEGKALTNAHESALTKLTGLMDKDLRTVAQKTNGKYDPPAPKPGVERLVEWLDGAQGAFGNAMAFAPKPGKDGNINPADFLKLQYSIQRASQRVEVFSNVIGSTVSGIKSLMSTQLG